MVTISGSQSSGSRPVQGSCHLHKWASLCVGESFIIISLIGYYFFFWNAPFPSYLHQIYTELACLKLTPGVHEIIREQYPPVGIKLICHTKSSKSLLKHLLSFPYAQNLFLRDKAMSIFRLA